jgi:hypothetical protein
MLRLGAMPDKACQMDLDHIFICRLKLLIIMTRTYLEGYPLGTKRKAALISNADYIAAESVDLEQLVPVRSKQKAKGEMNFDHVFFQRVKLLASMAKAIGGDQPMGEHRRAALADNVDMICDALKFTSGVKKVQFLKAA